MGVRRQSGIVVGFLNQVLRAATPVIKPDHEVDGLGHVRYEDTQYLYWLVSNNWYRSGSPASGSSRVFS